MLKPASRFDRMNRIKQDDLLLFILFILCILCILSKNSWIYVQIILGLSVIRSILKLSHITVSHITAAFILA